MGNKKLPYSRNSLARAFEYHCERGLFKSWQEVSDGKPGPQRYVVDLNGGSTLALSGMREAYVFNEGLHSAGKLVPLSLDRLRATQGA